VFGGEAAQQDLDLIRTDKGLDACAVSDSPWTGWAAVDTLNSIFLGQAPRQAGFGTIIIDKGHNLPPSGPFKHTVDYRALYKRAWGVP
jgi:ribose transport system substrate-binding protein